MKAKSIPNPNLNWSGSGDLTLSHSRRCLWATEVFHEIEDMVGKERAKTYLEMYLSRLGDISGKLSRGEISTFNIRETAHNVKSMSGQLGFEALCALSGWIMVQPDVETMHSNMPAWLGLMQASSDAARLYACQSAQGLS